MFRTTTPASTTPAVTMTSSDATVASFTRTQKTVMHLLVLAFVAVAGITGIAVGNSLSHSAPASAATTPASAPTQTASFTDTNTPSFGVAVRGGSFSGGVGRRS